MTSASVTQSVKQALDTIAASVLPPANPATELRDLRLSRSSTWQKLLEPLLKALRFEIEEAATRKSYSSRQYTLIKSDRVQRTLIYIPKWILNNPDEVNMEIMMALATAFEEGAKLLIFSDEDLPTLPLKYNQMLKDVWERRCRITAQFVPWEHYKEFARSDLEQQILLLSGLLELEESPPAEDQDPVLTAKRRRLELREQQAAIQGINTPPEIQIEIADLKQEIEQLKKRN